MVPGATFRPEGRQGFEPFESPLTVSAIIPFFLYLQLISTDRMTNIILTFDKDHLTLLFINSFGRFKQEDLRFYNTKWSV